MTPQEQVAQDFMERKGLGQYEPVDVEPLDEQPCWYFYYELPDGELELEVSWNEARMEWDTLVTSFTVA